MPEPAPTPLPFSGRRAASAHFSRARGVFVIFTGGETGGPSKRKMPKATAILRQYRKAIEDRQLLQFLQLEIARELSFNRFKNRAIGPSGRFRDVGKEIAISAMLGPEISETEYEFLTEEVSMQVSLRNPGLPSILQPDCGAFA